MRQLPLARASGLELARDVPAARPGALPLLRRGTALRAEYVRRLHEAGIRAVWVHDELSDGILAEPPLPEPVRAEVRRATAVAIAGARDALERGQALPREHVASLTRVVELVLDALGDDPHALSTLGELSAADAYTHGHSVGVTVCGLLVGRAHLAREGWRDFKRRRRYDRLDERLVQLGLGLLLHDVGKAALPSGVLQKPGRLTPEEWALVREHPEAGIRLLRGADLAPTALAVVRSHHERPDGTGYPAGLAEGQIHLFPSIAAVADVFDAVTSERPYAPARPDHVGVRVVCEGAGTQFDPAVVETFRAVVLPYPVGTTLVLADGREAVVASVAPDDPERVVVRVRDGAAVLEEEHRLAGDAAPAAVRPAA